MNNVVFKTGGDWDSTTLTINGTEIAASQFFLELRTGRFGFGSLERGGIKTGGELTAFVRPQFDPRDGFGVFPGRLELNFPGQTLIIENTQPQFAFEFTRVIFNGVDVTNSIQDVFVDVNAIENVFKAYFAIYEPQPLVSEETGSLFENFVPRNPYGNPAYGFAPSTRGFEFGGFNGGFSYGNRVGNAAPSYGSSTPSGYAPNGFTPNYGYNTPNAPSGYTTPNGFTPNYGYTTPNFGGYAPNTYGWNTPNVNGYNAPNYGGYAAPYTNGNTTLNGYYGAGFNGGYTPNPGYRGYVPTTGTPYYNPGYSNVRGFGGRGFFGGDKFGTNDGYRPTTETTGVPSNGRGGSFVGTPTR